MAHSTTLTSALQRPSFSCRTVVAACVSLLVGAGCLGNGSIEGPALGVTGGDDAGAIVDPATADDAGGEPDARHATDASPVHDAGATHDGSPPHDAATPPSDTAPPADDVATPPADAADETPVTTPPTGDSLEAARVKCVANINQYRATLGLAPYARWDSGESCVDGEAEADGKSGVAHSAFGHCGEWAQNECPGWPGPTTSIMDGCLKMMWDEGPGQPFSAHGHYINMSSTSYTKVSCGFHLAPDGSWWATQDFQ